MYVWTSVFTPALIVVQVSHTYTFLGMSRLKIRRTEIPTVVLAHWDGSRKYSKRNRAKVRTRALHAQDILPHDTQRVRSWP